MKKKEIAKYVFNQILEESALWSEDKDDALGLPDGDYLYNVFLDKMESIVRTYKYLDKIIGEYEETDAESSSELHVKMLKKRIAETYHELCAQLNDIVNS